MEDKEIIQDTVVETNEQVQQEAAIASQKELTFDYNDPDYKKRKKKASIIATSIVVALIVMFGIVLWVWFFIVNYPIITFTHKNIDDLIIDYTISEDGQYITNINYDDYLPYSPSIFDELFSRKVFLSQQGASEDKSAAENTAIIQNVIDTAKDYEAIYVDGNYKITSLQLKDNTSIIINENCSLIGPTYEDGLNIEAIIWAKDATKISIYGPGSICGNGTSYTKEATDPTIFTPLESFNVKSRVLEARYRIREAKDKDGVRPNIINFEDCENVKIYNVRLYESAYWTLRIKDSNDIAIKDIVIDNNVHVANADGIDLVSCQDVKITHCFIATADDGIVLKTNGEEDCKKVKVERCSIMSMANNFKIGTETIHDVYDVSVTNCYFFMPTNVCGGYAGVAIESADGANIKKVYVDNIYMKGVSSPMLIWLGRRIKAKKTGSIKDVTVSNITAKDVELASAITGIDYGGTKYRVQNVKVANFNVNYRNTKENLDVGDANYEVSMLDYPEITRVLHLYKQNSHEASDYFDMPVYGLFARHVSNLKVYNLNINPRSCNTLPRDNITQAKDRCDVLDVSVN